MKKVELGEEERIRASEARTTTWLRIAVVQQVLLIGLFASAPPRSRPLKFENYQPINECLCVLLVINRLVSFGDNSSLRMVYMLIA